MNSVFFFVLFCFLFNKGLSILTKNGEWIKIKTWIEEGTKSDWKEGKFTNEYGKSKTPFAPTKEQWMLWLTADIQWTWFRLEIRQIKTKRMKKYSNTISM